MRDFPIILKSVWKSIFRLGLIAFLGFVMFFAIVGIFNPSKAVLWIYIIGVVTLATAAVWHVWHGFKMTKPDVARADLPDLSENEKRFVRMVRRDWRRFISRAGLAIKREDKKGNPLPDDIPRIAEWKRSPLGLIAVIEPVRGEQAVSDFTEADGKFANRLSTAFSIGVRVAKFGHSYVSAQFEMRDALAGVRYSQESASSTVVRLGRSEHGTDAVHDLADATHIAVQGQTRSGKSALCYTILGQIAVVPQVRVWGLDPNRVLLRPLEARDGTARIAAGKDVDEYVRVLEDLCAEMNRRLEYLGDNFMEKFTNFTPEAPLEVLVLEEYDGLKSSVEAADEGLKPAERRLPRIKRMVREIVAQGAKAGIRVILITQRMDASIVDGATRGQLGTRITMAVDNDDAVKMLHPKATPETVDRVMRFKPGQCLLWQNRTEQIMQADLTEYDPYLARFGIVRQGN